MNSNANIVEEALRIVKIADDSGVTVRLIGGVAIYSHTQHKVDVSNFREIQDIDVVLGPKQGKPFTHAMERAGYEGESRFNALHGSSRLIFHGPISDIDVMVGTFEMCHRIEMSHRLLIDYPTVSLADLLLTKLQIVELNKKDADDIFTLLEYHDLSRMDDDSINLERIDEVTSNDWGLWRTVNGTVCRLKEMTTRSEIISKLSTIEGSLRESRKSPKFWVRGLIGERVQWFELPEESQ